jgi:predicted O-methyltransferase YrrM
MNQDQWTAVDHYITGLLVPPDEALDGALRDSAAASLPPIAVSPPQGKLLHLLARMQGARLILEIGTLGGYSTIWLARALPAGGRLVTLEVDPRHAETARANLARAGLAEVVELPLGAALETLPELIAEKRGLFDLIFIDADKGAIPEYFARALELSRRGTMIIVDNVVRNGAVADPANTDPAVLGVRRFHQLLAAERRVSATTIQTVGSKGYDGFTLALAIADLWPSSGAEAVRRGVRLGESQVMLAIKIKNDLLKTLRKAFGLVAAAAAAQLLLATQNGCAPNQSSAAEPMPKIPDVPQDWGRSEQHESSAGH